MARPDASDGLQGELSPLRMPTFPKQPRKEEVTSKKPEQTRQDQRRRKGRDDGSNQMQQPSINETIAKPKQSSREPRHTGRNRSTNDLYPPAKHREESADRQRAFDEKTSQVPRDGHGTRPARALRDDGPPEKAADTRKKSVRPSQSPDESKKRATVSSSNPDRYPSKPPTEDHHTRPVEAGETRYTKSGKSEKIQRKSRSKPAEEVEAQAKRGFMRTTWTTACSVCILAFQITWRPVSSIFGFVALIFYYTGIFKILMFLASLLICLWLAGNLASQALDMVLNKVPYGHETYGYVTHVTGRVAKGTVSSLTHLLPLLNTLGPSTRDTGSDPLLSGTKMLIAYPAAVPYAERLRLHTSAFGRMPLRLSALVKSQDLLSLSTSELQWVQDGETACYKALLELRLMQKDFELCEEQLHNHNTDMLSNLKYMSHDIKVIGQIGQDWEAPVSTSWQMITSAWDKVTGREGRVRDRMLTALHQQWQKARRLAAEDQRNVRDIKMCFIKTKRRSDHAEKLLKPFRDSKIRSESGFSHAGFSHSDAFGNLRREIDDHVEMMQRISSFPEALVQQMIKREECLKLQSTTGLGVPEHVVVTNEVVGRARCLDGAVKRWPGLVGGLCGEKCGDQVYWEEEE